MWVRLDVIAVRDPGTPRHVNGAGVDMTGERPGFSLTGSSPTPVSGWVMTRV